MTIQHARNLVLTIFAKVSQLMNTIIILNKLKKNKVEVTHQKERNCRKVKESTQKGETAEKISYISP